VGRSRKAVFDGQVVHREVNADGTVLTSDRNGRICWDSERSERVVLINDLRKYGPSLHIGQLGWTVPGSTDGYKWIDVEFDTKQRLPVLVYGLSCVEPSRANEIATNLIAKYPDTRFDSRPDVAEHCRKDWIRKLYAPYLTTDETIERGAGCQELYAFTFPTMRELAAAKGKTEFPMKIGYSANEDDGALGRIREQILEVAAYPEKPSVMLIFRTWNGRSLESQVHKELRKQGRSVMTAPGKEWFTTNPSHLLDTIEHCQLPTRDMPKPVKGSSETIEEGFNEILAGGGKIVFQMDQNSAAVRIGIEGKDQKPPNRPAKRR